MNRELAKLLVEWLTMSCSNHPNYKPARGRPMGRKLKDKSSEMGDIYCDGCWSALEEYRRNNEMPSQPPIVTAECIEK